MNALLNGILVSYLVFLSALSVAQKFETAQTFRAIIDHAENNSLYRDNVDWKGLKKELHTMADGADSVPQLKPALNYMLAELGDAHGRVFYKNGFLAYYSSNKNKARLASMDADTYTEIQSGQVYDFRAVMLDNEVGYVRIVALPMGDNYAMTSEIQRAVCALADQGAKAWVIDLRFNGGGNMFPMVEGITNIIGDGLAGGTLGVTPKESSVWEIRDSDFYYDEYSVGYPDRCPIANTPRIAVLTSMYTASSGEALAVILKGRPETRFFGSGTTGLITSTDWTQINPTTAMAISVSYYQDREGKVYRDFVDVDEEIVFDPKATLDVDPAVIRASQWLRERK